MKRVIVAAVSIFMAFALMACSMVSVNKEKDYAQIVAKIGDKTITKGEYLDYLDSALAGNGATHKEYLQNATPEVITEDLQNYVNEEMLYQEAVKRGMLDESEETKNSIKADIETNIAETKKYILDSVDPAITDEAKRQEEADKTFNEYMEMLGGAADIDTQVAQQLRNNALRAIQEDLIKDVSFTEDDAKAYYDEQSKIQSETIANSKDPKGTLDLYKQMGQTSFVRPEEARYVKHILISIPEEKQTEISTLKSEGKEEEAQKMLDEELAKIKPAVDDAYKRATSGENFDTLIEELGQDPGMKQEPEKTQGYLVSTGSGMVAPFEEAALALAKEGDISQPVASDFGYHIIKYEKGASGVIPFEEMKDSLISEQLSMRQNAALTEGIEKLKEGYKIELFEKVLSQ